MLRLSAILTCVVLAVCAANVPAADWPQWRGPTTLGYTDEKDLPTAWDAKTGQNVLWKVELPKSHNPYSSPIVSRGNVILTWSLADPVEHHVTCYRAADGTKLWDTTVPPGKLKLDDLRGGYNAPTPCADADRIYVVFGSGVVAALDYEGRLLWRHELVRLNFDVAAGSSPVLFADTVIYLADQTQKTSSLIAFDCRTGNVRWESLRPQVGFAHSTPAVVTIGGRTQLLIAASNAVQAADPSSGNLLWWCAATGDTASPAFADGLVYADSGRGGSPGVCVDAGGSGDVTATHLRWKAEVKNDLSSPIIAGGHVYRLASKTLTCLRLSDGQVAYRQPVDVHSWASPVATTDGLVYFATAGRSMVVRAGPKFDVVASSDLGDPHFASPAVADGRLYLRGLRYLWCIGRK